MKSKTKQQRAVKRRGVNIHIQGHRHIHISINIHVHVDVDINVNIHIHIHIQIHMHIHIDLDVNQQRAVKRRGVRQTGEVLVTKKKNTNPRGKERLITETARFTAE